MKILPAPRLFAAALMGATLLAANPVSATELREGEPAVTQLSADASAVTYFVNRPDGYHVIVTVRTQHDEGADALHQPPVIRFSSRILAGQTIDLSTPDGPGSADTVLQITRRSGRVAVETKQAAALVD